MSDDAVPREVIDRIVAEYGPCQSATPNAHHRVVGAVAAAGWGVASLDVGPSRAGLPCVAGDSAAVGRWARDANDLAVLHHDGLGVDWIVQSLPDYRRDVRLTNWASPPDSMYSAVRLAIQSRCFA
jgi:hypothetical protein